MSVFALIPGAGGSAWYWHRVVAALSTRDHRAVAFELPAHDPTADFRRYADDCVGQWVAAAGPAASSDTVVVGQSLGGFTAPLLAERLGAARIVLVNAMIPAPHETPAHWFATSGAQQARAALVDDEGRPFGADLDPLRDFFHDVPESVVAEAMSMGEPEQSDAILQCECPFESWPAPVTVITGRDDRFFPCDFQRRIAKERLGVDPTVIPGGHLVALSRPRELADALLG